MLLNELFDNALPTTVLADQGATVKLEFTTTNGQYGTILFVYVAPPDYIMDFVHKYASLAKLDFTHYGLELAYDTLRKQGFNYVDVSFEVSGTTSKTGKGEQHEIFATIVTEVKKMVAKRSPDVITFSAEGESRQKLYARLAKVIGKDYLTYQVGEDFYLVEKDYTDTLDSLLETASTKKIDNREEKDTIKQKAKEAVPRVRSTIEFAFKDHPDANDAQILSIFQKSDMGRDTAISDYLTQSNSSKTYDQWIMDLIKRIRSESR